LPFLYPSLVKNAIGILIFQYAYLYSAKLIFTASPENAKQKPDTAGYLEWFQNRHSDHRYVQGES